MQRSFQLATMSCLLAAVLPTLSALAQQPSYDELLAAAASPSLSAGHVTLAGYESKTPAVDKATKSKKAIDKHGVIGYEIYRDRSALPVDPRKPCSVCTQRNGDSKFAALHDRIPGFQGRPYQDTEPGACLCGKKKQKFKRLNFNVYWPTFAAGLTEELFPVRSAIRECKNGSCLITDMYDSLGGFELSPYQRRDNGYCGKGRDRYGCLGESQFFGSQVRGVGFRPGGQPVERGNVAFP